MPRPSLFRLPLPSLGLRPHRLMISVGAALMISLAGTLPAQTAPATSAQLPDRLTDGEFWKMITDFSESNGFFRSENFTSNETGFQWVIPELKRTIQPGGVYLGVGPEQNFTYIVALQPKLAFITDIRRQNLVQHLIYKALMEQYDNRADFVAHLFSRPRPKGLDTTSTAAAIFDAISAVPADSAMYQKSLVDVRDWLVRKHGFALSDSDFVKLNHVITAFYMAGPQLNYSFTVERGNNQQQFGGRGGSTGINYAVLMAATDAQGVARSYLATEANYRQLRDMELRNAIIPLNGDFGGPKALKAVGEYLKAHNATVTAFYCSNVEQYLFPSGGGNGWNAFYSNIAALPLDSTSTFIRSRSGGNYGQGGRGGALGTSVLASMQGTVLAFKTGQISTYQDILNMSHQPN